MVLSMKNLLEIMRQLRQPDTGCPWDREQTHASLRPYLLEEAAEAVDAITAQDDQAMCDELGDVLLQIAFHAVIAEETGRFDYAAIEQAIVDKMIRRHPHIFADTQVADAAEVFANWQEIKAQERGNQPLAPAERVPRSLPALMRAYELGKKLEWSHQDAQARAITALKHNNLSDALLAVVDYARAQGINPEIALREAADARAGLL